MQGRVTVEKWTMQQRLGLCVIYIPCISAKRGMKVVVDAIKHEIGLQGTMSPKEVIAAAAEQYGVEAGEGSLKEQVKRVAAELDIDTGW